MQRWQQLRAVLLLPGMVAGLIPLMLLRGSNAIQLGWGLPSPWHLLPIAGGLVCIGAGLRLLITTIVLFATRGHGTLAPWNPPAHLVVQGIYRRVRNPMITGVLSMLLGESLVFGSRSLLIWFLLVLGVNLTYLPLVEEPSLVRRFGDQYRLYRAHVPRWIPRRHPWTPPWEADDGAVSESGARSIDADPL